MLKRKKLWVGVAVFLFVFCWFFLNPSYSYYKLTKENKNALTLNGVELSYTITADNLENRTIQVPANSKQTVTMKVTSNNEKSTEYEVYYQVLGSLSQEEKDKVSVKCYENVSQDLPTGEISSNGVKTIVVEIENNNTVPVTIELGCQGGLIGRDLVLEQGNKIPVTIASIELVEMIKPEAVLDNIASEFVTSPTGIDFSKISSDTNGKGLYILHGTENNANPIMYYRGAVTNNNVRFANFCWKIVRTTETGGVKLIYNGRPNDNGQCSNTIESETMIQNSVFNTGNSDNAYVGYMYGTPSSSTYEKTHKNTNDSAIKTVIDKWYSENLIVYTEMLEDTIWCNDRSLSPNSSGDGTYSEYTDYGGYYRLYYNKTPSLECVNENDRFTVSEENGNGALMYPVALLTADEIAYAGAVFNVTNFYYYLYNKNNWWTMSPVFFKTTYNAGISWVEPSGLLLYTYSSRTAGIRPSVSLKKGTKVVGSGDGTAENPYVVE